MIEKLNYDKDGCKYLIEFFVLPQVQERKLHFSHTFSMLLSECRLPSGASPSGGTEKSAGEECRQCRKASPFQRPLYSISKPAPMTAMPCTDLLSLSDHQESFVHNCIQSTCHSLITSFCIQRI